MALSYESTTEVDRKALQHHRPFKGSGRRWRSYAMRVSKLDKTLECLAGMTYQKQPMKMKLFLTDYTEEELKPVSQTHMTASLRGDRAFSKGRWRLFRALFRGSTSIAFKDMALSILPHLMTTAAKKNHADKEIMILTATSGDTGKAAMAGFADVPGTRIIVSIQRVSARFRNCRCVPRKVIIPA